MSTWFVCKTKKFSCMKMKFCLSKPRSWGLDRNNLLTLWSGMLTFLWAWRRGMKVGLKTARFKPPVHVYTTSPKLSFFLVKELPTLKSELWQFGPNKFPKAQCIFEKVKFMAYIKAIAFVDPKRRKQTHWCKTLLFNL